MKFDMHYYGTYWAACVAGFTHEEAEKIAWAAQSVDELTFEVADNHRLYEEEYFLITTETLNENLDDILTCFDLKNEKDECLQMLRGIWMPFHFLPGNFNGALDESEVYIRDKEIIEKDRDFHDFLLMCRTNTGTVRRMIEHTKEMYRIHENSDMGLYAIGVAMHVLADTWSHQGFAGGPTKLINSIFYAQVPEKLIEIYKSDENKELCGEIEDMGSALLRGLATDNYSVMALGHGLAGHKPDIAWLSYSYAPSWGNVPGNNYATIHGVNNRDRFKSGLLQMIESMRYIRGVDKILNLTKSCWWLKYKAENTIAGLDKALNNIEKEIFSTPKPDQREEWKKFLMNGSINLLGEARCPKEYYFISELTCDGPEVSEEYKQDKGRVKLFMEAATRHRDDIVKYINETLKKHEGVKEDMFDLTIINKKLKDETYMAERKNLFKDEQVKWEEEECIDQYSNEQRLQKIKDAWRTVLDLFR